MTSVRDTRPVAPAKPERSSLLQRGQHNFLVQQLLETLLIIHTAPEYSPDLLAAIRGNLETSFKIAASYRLPSSFGPATSRYLNPFPALIQTIGLVQDLTRHTGFADSLSAVGRIFIHVAELLDEINPHDFSEWKKKHGV